jgi:beta-N-acetylglucosaminidase
MQKNVRGQGFDHQVAWDGAGKAIVGGANAG